MIMQNKAVQCAVLVLINSYYAIRANKQVSLF